MKIVIDHSYADFVLSDEAWEQYGKGKPEDLNSIAFRSDPDLVSVVEEIGKRANGKSHWGQTAELEIVNIPDGIPVQIENYDGNEWVAEVHRTWGKAEKM